MAENAFTALLQKVASGATPWKDSVRTVSTSQHDLTGLQTISGVLVEEGDRVLETLRTNMAECGIYNASAGAWTRAVDMASSTYTKLATRVPVCEGDYAGQVFKLTSPSNGQVRVGVTELTFEIVNAALPTLDFDSTLRFTSDNRQVNTDSGLVRINLPSQPYPYPVATETVLMNASGILVAEGIDPDDSMPGAFTAPSVLYVNTVTDALLFARLVPLAEVDLTAPTIVSATVDASDLDRLTVVVSRKSHLLAGLLTGLSLAGTMSVARTIQSLTSVSADGLTFTFALSGNLLITDAPTFVIAATTSLYSMNGAEATAGSTPVTMTGGDVAWSPSAGTPTLHLYGKVANLQGASHPTPIVDEGQCAAWVPTIGASNFVQASASLRPLYDATGTGLKEGTKFDGTDDVMTTAMTVGGAIGATSTAFEVIWSGKLNAVTSTSSGYNTAHCIVGEAGGWFALLVWLNGSNYEALVYGVSTIGGTLYASATIGASLPANGLVIEGRLTGGNLICSVNGVDGTPVPFGGTQAGGGDGQTLKLGQGAGGPYLNHCTRHLMIKSGSGVKETATINALIADLAA